MSEAQAVDAVSSTSVQEAGGLRWLRVAPLLLVALAVGLFFTSGAWRLLSVSELGRRYHDLIGFVDAHPVQSALAYMGAYAVVVGLSLPGALLMTLTGGALFGIWLGSAAAVAGASSGAVLMFLACRSALGDALRRRAERGGGLLKKIEAGIRANAFTTLLTLRLIPAVPFALLNLAAGMVKMRLSTYVAATVLGIIPSTVIYAGMGAGLQRLLRAGKTPDLHSLIQPQMLAPLFGLALLAGAPLALKAWKRRGRAG